jgi:peroxiredoxin
LEAWQNIYPEVRARGALLIAISPQLLRQNDFTVQQRSLTFPLLTDTGCRVAESFGIAYTVPETHRQHLRSILINIPFIHGDQGEETWRLPLPATFVLKPDANGEATIAFAEAHADHRVRPDPADVLAAL